MDDTMYWVGFSVFPGIGPKKFHSLLSAFGTAEHAWNVERKQLVESLGPVLTDKFCTFRTTFSPEDYAEKLIQKQVTALTLDDERYPNLLKNIPNAPFVLYVKGVLSEQLVKGERTIGIVGTRRITSYGAQVTRSFSQMLVENGYAVISGLAMGVDAIAHKITIDENGYTVAVLGCGVDCCYPVVNQKLYEEILASGGAIVSEYPLGMQPSKGSFPSRNRIIAGLSEAVLVTEGTEDSGALITAEDAMTIGRKVFAIPGPITSSLSKGPYKLIQKGGKLVTSAGEILTELGTEQKKVRLKELKGDSVEEQKIIDALHSESLHFDEMVKLTAINPAQLGMILSLLELKGVVSQREDGYSLIV